MLFLVQIAKHFGFKNFTKANDVGERCAQLIGHVADKFRLETVCSFQRVVAIAQSPFDAGAVGHVHIGQQGRAIRQRHKGVVGYIAIGALNASGNFGTGPAHTCDEGSDFVPHFLIIIKLRTGQNDVVDVRVLIELIFFQAPRLSIGGVEEFKLTVRAKHGNAFV